MSDLEAMIRSIVREELQRASTPASKAPDDSAVYLTAPQVAEWLGVSTSTLKEMRSRGGGPAFRRVARRAVRYAREDVVTWLAGRRFGT